jgi:hypothetical protein
MALSILSHTMDPTRHATGRDSGSTSGRTEAPAAQDSPEAVPQKLVRARVELRTWWNNDNKEDEARVNGVGAEWASEV